MPAPRTRTTRHTPTDVTLLVKIRDGQRRISYFLRSYSIEKSIESLSNSSILYYFCHSQTVWKPPTIFEWAKGQNLPKYAALSTDDNQGIHFFTSLENTEKR